MIEYRAGDSPVFTKQKMPGMRKASDVTLKKGIFKDDKAMWDWINSIKLNTIKRATVTISLLDESGKPVKTWELTNAWLQENYGGRFQGRRQHGGNRNPDSGTRRSNCQVVWQTTLQQTGHFL